MSFDADLDEAVRGVARLDEAVASDARAALDAKTKPRRSLGRLEDLATQIASVRGSVRPAPLEPVVVVAAGDHGVAHEGVSAYPQEVTGQMLGELRHGRRCGRRALPERGGAARRRGRGRRLAPELSGPAEPLARSRHRQRRRRAGHGATRRGGRARSRCMRSAASSPTRARASSHSGRWASATRPSPRRSRARCSAAIRPSPAAGGRAWTTRCRSQGRRRPPDARRESASGRRPARHARRRRRLRARGARGRRAGRCAAGVRSCCSTGSSRASRRSSPRGSRRPSGATSSPRTAHRSPAMRSSSRRSGSSRSSTSSCAWARAVGRRWRCRCSSGARAVLVEMATFADAGVTDTGR